MRRLAVIGLILLSSSIAGAGVANGSVGDSALLASANQALEGRTAKIELDNGQVVSHARMVVLGPERTTWTSGAETREVATEEIERITVEKRSRIKKWSKRGLWIGALVGGVGLGHSDEDGLFVDADVRDAVRGAAAGAAIGAGAAALTKARVVYEAPGSDR